MLRGITVFQIDQLLDHCGARPTGCFDRKIVMRIRIHEGLAGEGKLLVAPPEIDQDREMRCIILAMVSRFGSTPMLFHICSHRYRGMAVDRQERRQDRLEHLGTSGFLFKLVVCVDLPVIPDDFRFGAFQNELCPVR